MSSFREPNRSSMIFGLLTGSKVDVFAHLCLHWTHFLEG